MFGCFGPLLGGGAQIVHVPEVTGQGAQQGHNSGTTAAQQRHGKASKHVPEVTGQRSENMTRHGFSQVLRKLWAAAMYGAASKWVVSGTSSGHCAAPARWAEVLSGRA